MLIDASQENQQKMVGSRHTDGFVCCHYNGFDIAKIMHNHIRFGGRAVVWNVCFLVCFDSWHGIFDCMVSMESKSGILQKSWEESI